MKEEEKMTYRELKNKQRKINFRHVKIEVSKTNAGQDFQLLLDSRFGTQQEDVRTADLGVGVSSR